MGLTITCDQCARDITRTGNSIDYRLALLVQPRSSRGGFVTDMMLYPPLDRDLYFCGRGCLLTWAVAQHEADEAYANRPAAVWEREHRGHMISLRVGGSIDSGTEVRSCHTCAVDVSFPEWRP